MVSHVRAQSVPQSEKDYYDIIRAHLKKPTEASVAIALKIYGDALDRGVWESPLGNIGCSYDTYVKSKGNYAVAAQKAIQAARLALSEVKEE